MRERSREWIKKWIRDKLGVDCIVREVRKSGPVIVVKLEGEEGKKEVMKNKYKLKGERVFIENDLTYEEKKIQEKMSRWAKKKRLGGGEVKVGRGRLKIDGKWIAWEEIERKEREREEGGSGEEDPREERAQNFVK